MYQILKAGQAVKTVSTAMPCTVESFLGGGGQGEVYAARLGRQLFALKWYFPATATSDQRQNLETLIRRGPPNDRFLWPIDLAIDPGTSGFGYLMPLRDTRYKSIVDLMRRRVEPSFRALATAGLELSHSFLQLHAKGLCYRDISFGNVFFDPGSGHILICDNDNVVVDGDSKTSVLGTPRFMAPEVVRSEALPSTSTDLFSLSVLLFYMFMMHHPLEGKRESEIKCLDLPAMTKLYGTDPVFIFDPNDDSNRPVPGQHDNALAFWAIYPPDLRSLFVRAFTTGVQEAKNGRVRESEWRAAMVRLRDSIFYCGHCGAENFFSVDAQDLARRAGSFCWSCNIRLQPPPHIRINKAIVLLNHDTQLFGHHVDAQYQYDFSQPIATVSRHPSDPTIWGLRNVSATNWVVTMPDGTVSDVPTGRNFTLTVGARINLGRVEGEICV